MGGHLVGVIRKYMMINDLTVQSLAKRIGISESTLYQKFNNPSRFTWWDLYMTFKVLHIPAEEIVECFPGELKPVRVNVVLTNESGKEVSYVH